MYPRRARRALTCVKRGKMLHLFGGPGGSTGYGNNGGGHLRGRWPTRRLGGLSAGSLREPPRRICCEGAVPRGGEAWSRG